VRLLPVEDKRSPDFNGRARVAKKKSNGEGRLKEQLLR
jgi:hypothetical protein